MLPNDPIDLQGAWSRRISFKLGLGIAPRVRWTTTNGIRFGVELVDGILKWSNDVGSRRDLSNAENAILGSSKNRILTASFAKRIFSVSGAILLFDDGNIYRDAPKCRQRSKICSVCVVLSTAY